MAPEFGSTAAMFYIDEQTINYLKLTGRDDELVKLVETYAKETGLWADSLENASYERVLSFDLSSRRAQHRRAVATRTSACRPPSWPRAASAARWKTSRA